eukprot:2841591-Alexandrium_andersonii.AAC.1
MLMVLLVFVARVAIPDAVGTLTICGRAAVHGVVVFGREVLYFGADASCWVCRRSCHGTPCVAMFVAHAFA